MANSDNINNNTKSDGVVLISQAADILGVSIDTVRRWDKAGTISSTRPDGKNRYFSVEELEKVKLGQPLLISEAAQMLKVSASTLRRLEKRGLIAPIRTGHGERRYDRKTLENFLDSEYFIRQKEVEEEVLEPLKPAPSVEEVVGPQINQPGVELAIKRLISEHHINIRKLRERFGLALGISAVIVIPVFILVGVLTTAFLVNPESTAKKLSLDYASITNSPTMVKAASTDKTQDSTQSVNGDQIKYKPNAGWKDNLRPLVNVALFLVKQVDSQKYAAATKSLKISDVNSIFQPREEGGIQSLYTLFLDSNELNVNDQGLVFNLNSDLLHDRRPGNSAGDIAILPLSGGPGGAITDASITTVDIANGAITSNKLASDLNLNVDQITTTNDLTIGNGLTLTTGALNLTATSGALTLSGLSASSINTGANALTITSSNFNTTATGINSTAIGVTTPAAANFTSIGATTVGTGAFSTISTTGQITSTLATGTAPLVVASTTNIANLNASFLNGATFAAPGAIGGGTPSAGAFTTLSATTLAIASITDSSLATPGVVTNTATGVLGTLAGTATTVLHGNAAGLPTFSSVVGGDLAANISISTTGNIATTGAGTISSAGLLTASGGLTLTTGALNLTATSGALTLSGLSASSINTGANALTITSSNFNTTATGINSTAIGATTTSTGAFTTLNSTGLSVVSANTTGLTISSALNLSANSLTTGTGLYAASSTLTSGLLVNLQVSGTAAAASQTALNILTTGANAINAITTYGAQISNTHTNATSGTNVALYLNASGATTANYGLIVNAGNVGIGTTTPNNALEIRSTTTPQLRVAYDTSNYYTESVSSAGAVTLTAVGSSPALNLQPDGSVDVNIAGGSGTTGCSVANSTGNLTCAGNITGASSGTAGYWARSAGAVLSPATANDLVSITNTATSQTTNSLKVLNSTSSGSFTTTGGDITNYAGYFANTSTDTTLSGATYGAFGDLWSSGALTVGSGFNLIHEPVFVGDGATYFSTEWKSSPDTTVDVSTAVATEKAGIAVEILGSSSTPISQTAMDSGSAANVTSKLTASKTPTANALQLLSVWNEKSNATETPSVPTVTGNGLTWVQVATQRYLTAGGQNNIFRVTTFRALGSSPSTGQLTIDFGGVSNHAIYSWSEFTNVNTGGTNGSTAVPQSATAQTVGTATSLTVTLGAFTGGSATGLTNVGLYSTATTGYNNYAAIFEAGNVGIGTTTPGGTLSIVSANGAGLTTSSALSLSANSLTTGTGLYVASSSLTQGTLGLISSTSTTQSSGKLFSIDHTATYTTTVANSGNLLNLNRGLTTSGAGALTTTGAVAAINSNCTVSAGSCTDSANILSLTQSYASASGAVLAISNSGTGVDIRGTSSTWQVSKAGVATFGGADTTLQFSATTATEKVCGTQTDATLSAGIIRDCSGTPGDYAEEYGSSDPTIEAGDVVALDPTRPAHEIIDKDGFKGSKAWVIKASKTQRSGLIGIISTQPNDVIGRSFDPSENPRPVALSGRLPVKISTENGPIAIGDYLTASSIPGVATKALETDPVVAVAEAPYTDAGIGKIIAYLHLSYIFGDNIADQIDVNQLDTGLEIVAPKVTTKDLTVDTITPLSDNGLNLELGTSGKFIVTNLAGLTTDRTVISFDSLGNASFSGTVTADRIVANQIVSLSVATNGSTNQDANNTALEDLSIRLSAVENQLSFNLTNGVLETQGLIVLGSGLKVDKISAASNAGEISLMGDVSFLGRPYFTSDTAGFAKIAKGQRRVQVTFDKEYVQQPIVNVTISISGNDSANRVTEQTIFDSKVQYVVTDTTTKGFVIVIDKDSPTDVQFSWAALAVKDAKTFSLVPTGYLTVGSEEQGTN